MAPLTESGRPTPKLKNGDELQARLESVKPLLSVKFFFIWMRSGKRPPAPSIDEMLRERGEFLPANKGELLTRIAETQAKLQQ